VILLAAVAVSALPYVLNLGFYSDDWYNLTVLWQKSTSGIAGQIHGLYQADHTMMQRPVQALYFATAFKLFGMHAVPYHLLNITAIAAATVTLYVAGGEVFGERWLAFVIALCFGLMPHYTSDRFWFTMQHANLSAAFAFLGTWSISRGTHGNAVRPAKWFILGAALFTLSFLSYEVMLGWIVASIVLVTGRSYMANRKAMEPQRRLRGILLVVVPLIIVGLLKIASQRYISTHHHFFANLALHLRDAIAQAIEFNFWSFGLKLPMLIATLLRHSALDWNSAASAGLVGVIAIAYLWRNFDSASIPNPWGCVRLALLGLAVFGLGYALFIAVPPETFAFTSAGLDNRVTIGAAPGAACVLVALAALACAPVRSELWRVRCFSVLMGLVCAANCLVIDGIASYWIDAASQQRHILKSLVADSAGIPSGSEVLLDGFCRYSGPGFIFEADGDATGAVQIALNNPSIKSDVISPDVHFDGTAVDTTYYGAPEQRYPYGRQLFIYDVRSRTITNLSSQSDAQNYFQRTDRSSGKCPAGRDGNGVDIF